MYDNDRELERQHSKWLEPPGDVPTEPQRAKITITFEMEYEIQPQYYPDGMTAEEMVELDVENYKGDFMLLIDHEDAKMKSIEGELV